MDNPTSIVGRPSEPAVKGYRLKAVTIITIGCVCGWFMMQLEILGVRILVPYFGSAIYVVSGSVIGVFLLSLSIGYLLGGWLCEKINAWILLGAAMTMVGIWKGLIPVMTGPVCDYIFESMMDVESVMDEKWGSLVASLALFCIPTVLLGTVSPTVMHWLAVQTGNSGFSGGVVLATSTISSFAGCLVAAFYLVLYSLRATLFISGIILVVLGLIVLLSTFMQATHRPAIRKEPRYEKSSI
ncbi:MAG: fused MFS/spermidine synthase [Phycisphaerae bacterium]|nr:fused MFS/spermidine synthase [Phycisphaerae bacterium]